LSDGHVSQHADRLASTRAWPAAAVRDLRSAGTASPVPKYISSGVCPRNARMRKHVVVFVNVERHQPADRRDAIERVEEEPLMFQGTPPGFDHRVENVSSVKARRRRRTPVSINSSTWAFTFSTPASATTTGALVERVAPRLASSSTATVFDRCERVRHAPRQNPSREVVDHGVQIGACPVEQADDGSVDVPHLVSSGRAQPHLRFRRMHAEAGASPAVRPYEAVPGRRRRRHGAEPLREDGERAGRDVTVLERGDHVPDRLDLGGRQSMR
jgi:hypothetical protein